MSTQGRVMVVEQAILHPGTCYLCISAGQDGRKFVDFGTSKPKHGRIYFCSYCFEEVCSSLGWASPSNWEKAELQVMTKEEEIRELRKENEKLKSLLMADISSLVTTAAEVIKKPVGRPKKNAV